MARTKLVVVALILLAGSVVCGAAAPELVQVGKLKVEAKIEGAGSPAVIFESGFTGGLFLWGPVQSQVGNETQTLSYERAGLGRSDLSAEPRSAERIARELHALLAAKAIAPPYILVGHSAGGLYVRIFAHMYPNEIAGLVLVDPATEEDYERMQKDKTVEDLEKMGMPAGAVAQWRALPETIDQARHAWPLPAVPVIVLTSKKPIGQWPLATAEDMQRWLEAHNQLAARIPAAEHIVIPGADHLSILKEGAVVEQITKMVDGVRAKRRQLNPAMLVRVPLRSHQLNSRRYMQSSRLPIKVALTTALAVLIAGCAAPTAVVQEQDTPVPCPEWTKGQLGLVISVVPIAVPKDLTASEGAVPGYGIQARKLSIAVNPPPEAAGVHLIGSTLSIHILGGNFRSWATPADQFAVAPTNSHPRTVSSTQAFDVTPGRARVRPFLSGKKLHAQTQAIDVAIAPGGAAVDQSVVVTSSLWDPDRRPIAPAQLNIELTSLRLSSIYETVEATIDLDYDISSVKGSVTSSCSASRHEVLVDRDAIRPALWDIGVPISMGTARKRWLALYSPATGAVRAVFTTPEAARAFTAWLQQVGGATAGKYGLGLFTPANTNEKGRILPLDTSIMDTFQPISADDIALLKVGEIDKP